ncbi:uncharacterized protein LOC114754096 [Neltuma alba]|uniref:uncharacterized protein LOC114754096 n=1 Tax=Neltuma alba TaxID=207710 RepID=UPI0010A4120A|nr:uncharacterized protein LOC114754096 [Prosopis alba]
MYNAWHSNQRVQALTGCYGHSSLTLFLASHAFIGVKSTSLALPRLIPFPARIGYLAPSRVVPILSQSTSSVLSLGRLIAKTISPVKDITTRKIDLIKQRLLTAQSRQKSYADRRRRPLEFDVGDHVFLKVSPLTGIGRSIKAKKLTPRFIGPYEILERIGPVAYRVALPPHLSNIHDVFHVSQLKKYHPDPSHIIEPEEVELRENLTYKAEPERILDVKDKQLRNKTIRLVKVF